MILEIFQTQTNVSFIFVCVSSSINCLILFKRISHIVRNYYGKQTVCRLLSLEISVEKCPQMEVSPNTLNYSQFIMNILNLILIVIEKYLEY